MMMRIKKQLSDHKVTQLICMFHVHGPLYIERERKIQFTALNKGLILFTGVKSLVYMSLRIGFIRDHSGNEVCIYICSGFVVQCSAWI